MRNRLEFFTFFSGLSVMQGPNYKGVTENVALVWSAIYRSKWKGFLSSTTAASSSSPRHAILHCCRHASHQLRPTTLDQPDPRANLHGTLQCTTCQAALVLSLKHHSIDHSLISFIEPHQRCQDLLYFGVECTVVYLGSFSRHFLNFLTFVQLLKFALKMSQIDEKSL